MKPVAVWNCSAPECLSSTSGAGNSISLTFIGWGFSSSNELYCPLHHPRGEEGVEAQLRGTEVFLQIIIKLDPASPKYDPSIFLDLAEIMNRPSPKISQPPKVD